MTIDVVIPIHNQLANIAKLLKGIDAQTVHPNTVIFVLDRTHVPDDMISQFKSDRSYVVDFIDFIPNEINATRLDGFFAGAARNAGINKSFADVIIMIDGDCVPQPTMIESHLDNCKHSIPVLSCGKRREKNHRWKDRREDDYNLTNIGFFSRNLLINDPELLRKCMVVWSCNIAINRLAINRLRSFNELYYGRREVFSSAFDGGWGGEDSFLGIQAWIAKVFIVSCPGSAVEHIDHPRPPMFIEIQYKQLFDKMLNDVRVKTSVNPLGLDFFSSTSHFVT